ncbi:MAG: glycosyltransferase family 9 protein [Sedimentisphaerales bacterium]|jgi:lipopolysaccharide heptosyltransferase I
MTANLPERILIIKPSALGDIVLALPVLSSLKRSFPRAKISWLVRPEYAPLLEGHPYISDIILFDRKRLSKWWCDWDSFNSLLSLVKQLRAGRFDLVFDFQGLFRTGFLAWVTGSRRRFGMSQAREFAHLFYTNRISQDYSCVHLVDYYLRMVNAAGAQQMPAVRHPQAEAEFKLPEAPAIDKLLAERGITGNYAVFVPGAAQPNKRWPIERFAQLADKISGKFGLSITAAGSQAEREYIDTMQARAKSRVVNLAGQTSVRELTALLKKASLVVSNDTGPGHIAAALGVPIVMIFGPTNPARVCPYNRPECAVAVEPDKRGMKADSYDPRHDIGHITLDQVFEKVYKQMTSQQGVY